MKRSLLIGVSLMSIGGLIFLWLFLFIFFNPPEVAPVRNSVVSAITGTLNYLAARIPLLLVPIVIFAVGTVISKQASRR